MHGWPFRIRSLGYNNYAPFAKLDLSHMEEFGVEQELSAYAHRIFAHVLALWQSHTPHAQHFSIVERMRQFLVTDQKHVRSITSSADQAGLCASRLRVLFKRSIGLSPKQFQLEARVSRAERLLANSDLSIGVIAEQTGFESVYHFSRQFKRMRSVSPAHYRTALANAASGGNLPSCRVRRPILYRLVPSPITWAARGRIPESSSGSPLYRARHRLASFCPHRQTTCRAFPA